MKILLTLFFLSVYSVGFTQKTDSTRGRSFLIAAGPGITIGEFTDTHPFSIGTDFSWSNRRFGRLHRLPENRFWFSANLGVYIFFGKEKVYSGQQFSFEGYRILSLSPGLNYHLSARSCVGLNIGPALNRYAGEFEAGADVALNAGYFFKRRYGIKPSLHWVKLSKADPIIYLMLMISGNY
jgi:hypothetical protein